MNRTRSNVEFTPLMEYVASLPEAELPASMRVLSVRARAFVFAVVFRGLNASDAAREVSATTNRESQNRIGFRYWHTPEVAAAIKDLLSKRIATDAPRMYEVLASVATDKRNKAADRLKASKAALDLAGYQPALTVNHEHTVRAAPTLAELYASVGMKPPKALAAPDPAHVIDAEFTEVATDPGRAGLEDLLP